MQFSSAPGHSFQASLNQCRPPCGCFCHRPFLSIPSTRKETLAASLCFDIWKTWPAEKPRALRLLHEASRIQILVRPERRKCHSVPLALMTSRIF